jgi:hypothetical protein
VRWHSCFESERASQPLPATGKTTGVDRGVHVLAATSESELIRKGRLADKHQRAVGGHARPLDAVTVKGAAGRCDQERQPDDGVTFESSEEEAKRLTGLVLRRMNEITRDFEQETLQPIFVKRCAEDGVTQLVFADAWCVDYLRGMTVHGNAWEPLVTRSDDDRVYLTPIFALALSLLASDTDDDETPNALLNEQKRAQFACAGSHLLPVGSASTSPFPVPG